MDTKNRFLVLYAVEKIGAPTPLQLERCLFETGLTRAFDLYPLLSTLVEEGLLRQSVLPQGLVYQLCDTALAAIAALPQPDDATRAEIDRTLEACGHRFLRERDYIAQYTESSTGVVPVFLSIRQVDRILLKINLLVSDVPTAEAITRNWMENAHNAYHAVWDSIAQGLPFPELAPLQEGKR